MCGHLNIRQSFIGAHHPASNGLVERANCKILKVLRHVTNGVSQTWDKWLSHIAASINASYSASINESPHFVLFSEGKRLPYDVLLSKPQPLYNPEDYAKLQLTYFHHLHQTVRTHLRSSNSNVIERQHKSARPVRFENSDIVFFLNLTRNSKLDAKHLGPFRVIARNGNKCTIRDLETHETRIFHATNLRAHSCEESDFPMNLHLTLPTHLHVPFVKYFPLHLLRYPTRFRTCHRLPYCFLPPFCVFLCVLYVIFSLTYVFCFLYLCFLYYVTYIRT